MNWDRLEGWLASVMGVIIPPSILMIVWGGLMSVSIGGLFLAGVVPGLMIGLTLMGTVYLFAKSRGYPVYVRSTGAEFWRALRRAGLALVTPLIIVGGIVGGLFTPTEASVVAVVYAAVLGIFVYRTIKPTGFSVVLYDSARLASISLFCIGTAAAFGWLLAYYRVPQAVVGAMSGLSTGVTSTGFLVAAAFLFVGCFIDAIPAIMIVGTMLMPLAHNAGMHPIHFAIIGVVSLAFGLVTPPYGLCLMIASTIGQIKLVQALRDVGLILIGMLLILVLLILFPEIVLWLPRLIAPKYL